MATSANVERIIHEVAALSEQEREELMRALEPVDEEWSREIHRRAREIDEGKVRLVDEDEFLRKLRAV
jgi:hypothetical protein